MNYWIRCNNCGKVGRYPYSSDTKGDNEANKLVMQTVKEDGWIYSRDFEDIPRQEFCCEACRQEWNEHYVKTGAKLNLPVAYRYQEQLKREYKTAGQKLEKIKEIMKSKRLCSADEIIKIIESEDELCK